MSYNYCLRFRIEARDVFVLIGAAVVLTIAANVASAIECCGQVGQSVAVPPAGSIAQKVAAIQTVSETKTADSNVRQLHSVYTLEATWFDAGRGRSIPAKIYYPGEGDELCPVILFSHGLGRSKEDYVYLGTSWAQHGYVAVFVQHAGSDVEVRRGTVQPMKKLAEAYANPINTRNRPLDLRFALDQLTAMQKKGDSLGKRLDLTKVGAAGNDMGAQAVLALAGEVLPGGYEIKDPRVRCVVAMSPPVATSRGFYDAAFGDIRRPTLFITGTEDDSLVGETKAAERRVPFDYGKGVDQFLVTLNGADHLVYAGHILSPREAKKDAQYQSMITSCCGLFFDAYLKGDGNAFASISNQGLHRLTGGGAQVETKLVAAKH